MFRRLACAVVICSIIPLGAASASAPKYAVHHAIEPVVSPDLGRIYFYRPSSFAGMMLEPAIKIDGEKVGDSSSGDYFYIDRPPGTYTISTETEKEETVSVPLVAGQTVYVRFEVSMGLFVGHVLPELVANDQAGTEIGDCHFVGTDAPTAPTPMATTTPPTSATPMATTPATTPQAQTTPTN
jgi:hypothetical protein